MTDPYASEPADLRGLIEHARAAVFRVELVPEPRWVHANPALSRLTGVAPAELGTDPRPLLGRFRVGGRELLTVVTEPGAADRPLEVELRRADGRILWLVVGVTPTHDDHGAIVGFQATATDITHLRRETEGLARENAELAALADVRQEMLSVASHELRTPLTPILGFADLLLGRRRDGLSDEHARMVSIIRRNARRMLGLVDDLLVLSRANAGALTARRDAVVPARLIAGVIEDLGDPTARIVVEEAVDRSVACDPGHLYQILGNLLTNAIKYGRPPIQVRIEEDDGACRIVVADAGDGVPAHLTEGMWDRFVQADGGDTRTSRGIGMGLAIVRMLADANGLEVGHEPNEPNGARFWVRLPWASDAPPPPPGGGKDRADEAVPRRGESSPPDLPGGLGGSGGPGGGQRSGPRGQAAGDPTSVRLDPAAAADPRAGDDLEVLEEPDDATGGEAVVNEALRQLLQARSSSDVRAVVLMAVHQLGGWTMPARLADGLALPIDLSFGVEEPLLPAAEPFSAARRRLETHLPRLVEDGRRVIETARKLERYAHDATTDPLTGLLTRQAYDRLLPRLGDGDTVAFIDLDGFKPVNDTHGHAAGDEVLRAFGVHVRGHTRVTDHACRIGGDEFVLVLEGSTCDGAVRLTERMRTTWTQVRPHAVTFSVGVATVHDDVDAAVRAADGALYEAKAAGGDRTVAVDCADGGTP